MELIKETDLFYIIRLKLEEELKQEIENFCEGQNIQAAWMGAIGSSKESNIAYYSLKSKQFSVKEFKEDLEIVGITGNIFIKDGKPFLHAHGTFSRPSMEVIGGHIMKCVISATCEVLLKKIEGKIERKYDEFTGLHLICGISSNHEKTKSIS